MKASKAFSLAEVVVAIGVFALAILGIVSALAKFARSSAESSETAVALGLAGAVVAEINIQIRDSSSLRGELAANTSEFAFVADKAGGRIAAFKGFRSSNDAIQEQDQFYHISFERMEDPHSAGLPLLLLRVTVSWPYRVRSGADAFTLIDPAQRQYVKFNLGLNP